MSISFGNWVRLRRRALDLTQQDLAEKVGCSKSAIVKIESSERRPSLQIAELLAEFLEIPADQRAQFLKFARSNVGTARPDSDYLHLETETPPHIPPKQNSLPVAPTPIVGREKEINIVVQQLQDPLCRLLTLTGLGGVGKTRLSIEVARQLETRFSDGVYYFSMTKVRLPESIIPVIADGLGLVFSGPIDPKEQVLHHLRTKEILLVIDNFEHLLLSGSLLGEILQQAPQVKMLITSREQLHLQWEWIFEVQGLPIPDEVNPNIIKTNSAIALFLQRARRISRGFSPNAEDVSALAQICKLVDGLPLAIELAASWMRILTCHEIALELTRGLGFLETTMHDMPLRHRSIEMIFDHSWKLLAEDERSLLMKLSVFQVGFTRESAYSVANASLELLSSLMGKSLLRYDKNTGRYNLHELTRQYALAQLGENPGIEKQTYERHARYYSNWLADREVLLKSKKQTETSIKIRAETANWRSAWYWAVQKRSFELIRQMIPCLYWYFEVHGYYSVALSIYKFAVDELKAREAPTKLQKPEHLSTFAFLIDQLGWFEFRTGNVEKAVELFIESLELARVDNDPEVLYHIYGNWGYMALLTGDVVEAKRLNLECLSTAEVLKSQWHIAIPTNVLGIVAFQQRNLNEAYQQLTDSLRLWRSVGDPRGLVFCMLYLGTVALALGNHDLANSVLQECNSIAANKMDRWAQAFSLDVLGQVSMSQGHYEEAQNYFKEGLEFYQEIGDQWGSTQTLIHLGESKTALEFKDEAKHLFLEAYATANQAKWIPTILEVLTAFLSVDHEISPQKKLAAAFVTLFHSATAPHVRSRAERLRDGLSSQLSRQQIEVARIEATQKSLEALAQEILK